MSGGSFGYLWCYTEDLTELLTKKDDIESMRVVLSSLGYAEADARETQELLDLMDQWNAITMERVEKLKAVWKAVEWWRSADSDEDDVREAVARADALRKEKKSS
jgi:Asp-tRNA(Asn)/Glu-tRNA(Gln) amidotransferase C subunit